MPEHERGLANGFLFGAFYVGQAIGGSGALYIAGAFGFRATFPFVLAVMTLILLGVSLRLREPDLEPVPAAGTGARGALVAGGGLWREIGARLRAFFTDLFRSFLRSGHGPLVGVVFGLLPAGAVALGLALGNAMQVDLGMDEHRIANLTVVTTVLGALGCVTGGWISDRVGHRRALAIWYVLTALPTFYLATRFAGTAGVEGVTLRAFYLASIAYSFAVGLRYGTSTAVFMGLTSPLVAATQFTGYMALMNVSISLSSLWQGQAAELWGYARVLTLDGLIAFVPLLLLPFLRPSTRGGGAAA